MRLGLGLALGSGWSPSVFTPASIVGLLAWYDMSLGATTSSGNLTALSDQSGTGDSNKNLTGSGTIPYTASDAAYNNKATATFAAAQRLEGAGVWGAAHAQPVTIYSVGEMTGGRIYDGNGSVRSALIYSASKYAMYAGGSIITSGVDCTTPKKVCVVFNGASSSIYVDTFDTADATNDPGSDGIQQIVLGSLAGGAGFLTGKIAAVIAYSGAHNSTQRGQVETYLTARFGV